MLLRHGLSEAGVSPWQPVPAADDRLDQRRLAELTPQPHHGHRDGVGERVSVFVPHPFQQLLGADHRAVGGHQHLQHTEFLAGQRDQLPVPAGPAPGPVKSQLTAVQHRRGGRCPAAEGIDPRDQLREVERLGQVVIRAEVQSVDPVIGLAGRGQHQDPGATWAPGQPCADIVPVHRRQVAVEHDDVVRPEPGLVQPGRAVADHVHGDALVTQAGGDGLRHHLVVLHDQHPHASIMPDRP